MSLVVNLVCFSQTGNTQKVAQAIGDAFEEKGCQVQIIPLEKAEPTEAVKCDIFAVGTPCFVSKAPTPVKNFLKDIPSLEDKPVFVFATSGGAPGRVLYDLKLLLEGKGGHVIDGLLIRGELFYPVPCVLGRFPDRPNNGDLSKAKNFAQGILKQVENGNTQLINEEQSKILNKRLNFYNIAGLLMTDPMIRLLLPSPKVEQTKCNECGICEVHCPTKSITLSPYPEFNKQCIRCYRCLTVCPEEAISINEIVANAVVYTFYNKGIELILGDIEKGEKLQ